MTTTDKQLLYVRTEMTIPGVGTSIHIAELEPTSATHCTLHRILELDPSNTIRGAAHGNAVAGMAAAPERTVSHPNSYANFPDITATHLLQEEFEVLWAEAVAKFSELR
ncbi:hypothetical protein CIP107509_00005 [Corynebacterium diphtheriae]|nr:hypothetical protein CIP107509_00005 [Corynebacterium diphtheriae]